MPIQCHGVTFELLEQGAGNPLVYLHSGEGLFHCQPVLDAMATTRRVIAPSHPGFGHSTLPAEFARIDDLAYCYLDLFDQMGLENAVLVGESFGAWIAAEIAIRKTRHLSHLVLADMVGVRHSSDETTVEIADIYTLYPQEVQRRQWVNPAAWKRDAAALSDDELLVVARNRETMSLFAWMPYMVNPLLRRWLHRIDKPTLVLWGAQDQITAPDYGRACARLIPHAEFRLIEGAAHHPSIEQPALFAKEVLQFCAGSGT